MQSAPNYRKDLNIVVEAAVCQSWGFQQAYASSVWRGEWA